MKMNLSSFSSLLGKDVSIQVSGFQVDSRYIGKGDLFFALKGKKVDGIDFLAEVAHKQAFGAVVRKDYRGKDYGLELFYVEDVLDTLQKMAHLTMGKEKIIGVTGSLGKTTTKEFIATLLQKRYKVGKTIGNYNSAIGLPLTLLNREKGNEILVLEMAMTEKGQIQALTKIAPVDLGVVTKITYVHIENFNSLEEIAKEKKSILSGIKGIVPYEWKEEGMITFSLEDKRGDYTLSREGDKVYIVEKGEKIKILPPFTELHFLEDLMIAFAVARMMGLKIEEIQEQIKELKTVPMRFEKVEKQGVLFIKDMYNSTLESVKMALNSLPTPKKGGRKIAVLGEMVELGAFSEKLHQEMGSFAKERVDLLFCLGKKCGKTIDSFSNPNGELFLEKKELVNRLKNVILPGDVVLIKGSRALKMETIFTEVVE